MQSILLKAWLTFSEDTKTFTCLYQTWLYCMDGKASRAIITYQDKTIKNAVVIIWTQENVFKQF